MNMKMKLLASTVSILCFSQGAFAADGVFATTDADCSGLRVCSTTTINGITKTFTFTDQATADAISAELGKSNPDANIVGDYVDPFRDTDSGALPATSIGLVNQTTRSDGTVVTTVQTSPSVTVVTEVKNGTAKATQITRETGSSASMSNLVDSFIKTGTVPTGGTKLDGVDEANFTVVQQVLQDVKSIPVAANSLEKKAQDATSASLTNMLLNTTPVVTPVSSTITLNGVTKTLTFANLTEAQNALLNPASFRDQFNNATSQTGQVSQTTAGGNTYVFAQTDAKTIVVATPKTDGTVGYVTLKTGGVNQSNLNKLLAGYLAGDKAAVDAISGAQVLNGVVDSTTATKFNQLVTTAKNQGGVKTVSGSFTLSMLNDLTDAAATTAKVDGSVISASNLLTVAEANQIAAYKAIINDPTKSDAEKQAALNNLKNALNAETNLSDQGKNDYLPEVTPSTTQAERDLATKILVTDAASRTTALNNAKANLQAVLADSTATQTQKAQAQTMLDSINAQIAIINKYAGKDVNSLTSAEIAELKAANDTLTGTNGLFAQAQALYEVATISVRELKSAAAAIGTAEANADMQQAIKDGKVKELLARMKTSKYAAEKSRSSGIAGNPVSIMNMTVDHMFNQAADYGQSGNTVNIAAASSDGGVKTSVGVGLQYGYYDLNGRSANTVSLPLTVSTKFSPKGELILSVPLSYIQTQNQTDAYQVGVTLGYKYNVNDNWSITPAASYAYRSFDSADWNNALRTDTSMVGGSVSSKYTWNLQNFGLKVSLTNMIGYYESLDNGAGNDISNYVTKNGLHATKSLGNFIVGAYFTDTEYFGGKRSLYFDQFNEVGLSLKPQNSGMLDALTVDANYLFNIGGNHSGALDGFKLNLGYKF